MGRLKDFLTFFHCVVVFQVTCKGLVSRLVVGMNIQGLKIRVTVIFADQKYFVGRRTEDLMAELVSVLSDMPVLLGLKEGRFRRFLRFRNHCAHGPKDVFHQLNTFCSHCWLLVGPTLNAIVWFASTNATPH